MALGKKSFLFSERQCPNMHSRRADLDDSWSPLPPWHSMTNILKIENSILSTGPVWLRWAHLEVSCASGSLVSVVAVFVRSKSCLILELLQKQQAGWVPAADGLWDFPDPSGWRTKAKILVFTSVSALGVLGANLCLTRWVHSLSQYFPRVWQCQPLL